MIECLLFGFCILILLVGVVHLCKILLKDFKRDDTNVSVPIRSVGQPTIEPTRLDNSNPAQTNQIFEQEYVVDNPAINTKSRSINYSAIGKLFFLLLAIGLAYSFKEDLNCALTSFINKTNIQKKECPLLSQDTNINIGGVNWHKIVATNSKGLQFTGWVSEFSIKESPPKPSKVLGMVDHIRKDIGLPTSQEQVESIKNFKKVSGNLKKTMSILRGKSNN